MSFPLNPKKVKLFAEGSLQQPRKGRTLVRDWAQVTKALKHWLQRAEAAPRRPHTKSSLCEFLDFKTFWKDYLSANYIVWTFFAHPLRK